MYSKRLNWETLTTKIRTCCLDHIVDIVLLLCAFKKTMNSVESCSAL